MTTEKHQLIDDWQSMLSEDELVDAVKILIEVAMRAGEVSITTDVADNEPYWTATGDTILESRYSQVTDTE